jgi:hypothetical protein
MSVLDPNWKYTHSTATDIRKTFAKARRDLRKQVPARQAVSKPAPAASTNVRRLYQLG